MSRIDAIFADLRQSGRKALMPFLCGGYPAPGCVTQAVPALERAGASIIEVGFPYSDPVADGPVIASAMHQALLAGVTPPGVFAEVAAARPSVACGLVAMVSVSIIQRATPAVFVRHAQTAGFDGLIVPDCPLEESETIRAAAAEAGLCFSMLIAPATPARRAEAIVKACTGFIYLLARAGITGEQGELGDFLAGRVERLRQMTDLPIACGFGISTAEQVSTVTQVADAAIVGSALVRRMGEAAGSGGDPVAAAADFTALLAQGLAIGPQGPRQPAPEAV